MARLIDADALLELVQFGSPINNRTAEVIARCVDVTRGLIEAQPTINAVEVVRCKDCHYHDAEYGYCCWWENDVGDNDFCSFAKKDGAEE